MVFTFKKKRLLKQFYLVISFLVLINIIIYYTMGEEIVRSLGGLLVSVGIYLSIKSLTKNSKITINEIIIQDGIINCSFFHTMTNRIKVNRDEIRILNENNQLILQYQSGELIGYIKKEYLINQDQWDLLLKVLGLNSNKI